MKLTPGTMTFFRAPKNVAVPLLGITDLYGLKKSKFIGRIWVQGRYWIFGTDDFNTIDLGSVEAKQSLGHVFEFVPPSKTQQLSKKNQSLLCF